MEIATFANFIARNDMEMPTGTLLKGILRWLTAWSLAGVVGSQRDAQILLGKARQPSSNISCGI
jgi:hypothetical protein